LKKLAISAWDPEDVIRFIQGYAVSYFLFYFIITTGFGNFEFFT